MKTGWTPPEMAVYSWCDLISPWRVVRAADQIVGKKQFSNFGVRVICILSVCIPAVREQILVVAHLVRPIGNVPPPRGAGAADSHPERDLQPRQLLFGICAVLQRLSSSA